MKEKKEIENFRSNCPLSASLDLFGDKWTLLIIRDLIFYKERTFKDFSLAKENISSSRLADRLSKLEKLNVLTKTNHPTNKKVFIYKLTQKGLDLIPIIAEFMNWSYVYLNEHVSEKSREIVEAYRKNPKAVLTRFKQQ
ncbi:MAG: helix-turn-helix domain-containing protein [Bacteroidota bacterium]